MNTPIDLPGMNFDDALAAWICAHVKATSGVPVDPSDITDQRIVHEDYYSNGDTDWPEENYVAYRYIWSPEKWQRSDVGDPHGAFLYDLLRVGLMTTLLAPAVDEAGAER